MKWIVTWDFIGSIHKVILHASNLKYESYELQYNPVKSDTV